MKTKVAPARPESQDVIHSAIMKIGSVSALLHAWAEDDRALNGSDLWPPLHILREVEAELINGGTS
jgi:hypothetical protein